MKTIKTIFLTLAAVVAFTSCDKILEVDDPIDSISSEAVFGTSQGIAALRNGFYTNHFFNNSLYLYSLDLFTCLMSDNLVATSTYYKTYYENSYTTSSFTSYWNNTYNGIYLLNDFITKTSQTSADSAAIVKQYRGEACWFRAHDYFLLVNLFGGVPIVLSAAAEDIETNSLMPRNTEEEVYEQIFEDLKMARELMANSTEANTRITPEAATALLARCYLYDEQWQDAVNEASKLIPVADGGQGTKFHLEAVDDVFKSWSEETILQIDQEGYSSGRFKGYCYSGAMFTAWGATTKYFFLSPNLVADLQADSTDLRQHWMAHYDPQTHYDIYYPYKYKNGATPDLSTDYENQIMMRLAEQYLIRAEANAHLGNLKAARDDINCIRHRAGQADFTGTTQDEILAEIELQREKEFFCEQGHRWMDLNRTGRADYFYTTCGYKDWESYKRYLPIPESECLANPNLTQNPGW